MGGKESTMSFVENEKRGKPKWFLLIGMLVVGAAAAAFYFDLPSRFGW